MNWLVSVMNLFKIPSVDHRLYPKYASIDGEKLLRGKIKDLLAIAAGSRLC
jgi:hypothetical protein